jgi:hypothetical protein
MIVAPSTTYAAFATLMRARLAPDLLFCREDLLEGWHSSGLRADDLDSILEQLYAQHHVDRTRTNGEDWYRVTASGRIELRICREPWWVQWRDRLVLRHIQRRRETTPPAVPLVRRRSDLAHGT